MNKWQIAAIALAAALYGCVLPGSSLIKASSAAASASPSPSPTATPATTAKTEMTKPSPTPVPIAKAKIGSLVKAETSAAMAINWVSRVGADTLKVRNEIKRQPIIGVPRVSRTPVPHSAYRVADDSGLPASLPTGSPLGLPGLTNLATDAPLTGPATDFLAVVASDAMSVAATDVVTVDATGDATIADTSGQLDQVTIATEDTTADAAGGFVFAATESIPIDTIGNESGLQTIAATEDASGEVTAGLIDYVPDATASAEGEGSESVAFTVPPADVVDGDGASISIAIATDGNTADSATITCSETESSTGDVATTGTISLPDGSTLFLTTVYHADGTEDLTGISPYFGFEILGLGLDGTGSGIVYDRDPDDPAAIVLGVIALTRNAGQIAFYNDDGVTLGTPQPFELLR